MGQPVTTRVVERVVRLEVGNLNRRVMRRLGQMDMTTAELADRLGVSRPRVSLLINSQELTVEAFERLTAALEVTPEWWETPVGRTPTSEPNAAGALMARVKKQVR